MTERVRTVTLRTVVWSTGGVGSIAIDAIAGRPDLDLVGVWVHSADKVGKDAGALAGVDPVGVAATNDADALIALRPDCVVYAASGPDRDAGAVPDYLRLLERGHQRRVDIVNQPGLSARLLLARVAGSARSGGQGRKRVVLRIRHLSRASPQISWHCCWRRSRRGSGASRSPRSRSTTTTRWPT